MERNINRTSNTKTWRGLTASLCAVLALSSCSQKEMYDDNVNAGKRIGYMVSCDYVSPSGETRCAEEGGDVVQTFELKSADGSLSIPVAVIETDGLPYEYAGAGITKGSLINGPEGAEGYTGRPIALSDSLDTFIVHAFDTDSQSPIFAAKDSVVKYTDSRWLMANAYYWPQRTNVDFYAYANMPTPEDAASVKLDKTNRKQMLTYTVPGNTDDQTDILMAIYSGTGTMNGEAEIRFMHPLTAVQFSREDTPEMTGVTNITMSGVHHKGQATQTLERPTDFTWVLLDNTTTTVVQDNDGKPFEVHGKIDGDPFMLIPQEYKKGYYVDLSVTVVYNGHNIPITARISNMKWQPGKTYTYVIGYEGMLEIEFTSDPAESATVTENAVVRNVGSKKCYVRATATGFIKDSENYVKSTWINDAGINKGTFTVGRGTFGSTEEEWNDHWIAGADGFWYYRKPLECSGTDEAAKNTTPLFDKYAITGLASGEVFELVVSAQAVQWDAGKEYITETWGEYAAGLVQ